MLVKDLDPDARFEYGPQHKERPMEPRPAKQPPPFIHQDHTPPPTYALDNPPTKSIALALVLAAFFGPFGLLYSSPVWAIILLILSIPIGVATFGIGLAVVWFVGLFISIIGAQAHNDRLRLSVQNMHPMGPTFFDLAMAKLSQWLGASIEWRQLAVLLGVVALAGSVLAIATHKPKPQIFAPPQDEPFHPAVPFFPPEQDRSGEIMPVDLETLWQAYEANEVRANHTYKGKRIELTGTVANIDETFGSISLTLRGSNRWHKAHAAMQDSMADRVRLVNKGTSVRIRCDVGGKMFDEPMLRNCAFAY
jgi:tRNA_anti-like